MRITPRGYFVAGFVSALALVLAFYVMSHVYWTPTGYCWGSVNECFTTLNEHLSVAPGK